MTISPVYTGRPAQEREPVEQQIYDLLDALHIPYQRVDHDIKTPRLIQFNYSSADFAA